MEDLDELVLSVALAPSTITFDLQFSGGNVTGVMDPFAKYLLTDFDFDGFPDNYYGYLAPDGYWYLKYWNETTDQLLYFAGIGDYQDAWAVRETFDYDTAEVIFG